MNNTFENKADVVNTLVEKWGCKTNSFYNTPTNKHVEKFWTYNRCLQYLFKLEREYVRTENGNLHKSMVY